MKTIVAFGLLTLSLTAFAKDEVLKFNDALIEQIHSDIKDEANDSLRTTPVTRAPASVESEPRQPQEAESKIDKNVRQTGSKSW